MFNSNSNYHWLLYAIPILNIDSYTMYYREKWMTKCTDLDWSGLLSCGCIPQAELRELLIIFSVSLLSQISTNCIHNLRCYIVQHTNCHWMGIDLFLDFKI